VQTSRRALAGVLLALAAAVATGALALAAQVDAGESGAQPATTTTSLARTTTTTGPTTTAPTTTLPPTTTTTAAPPPVVVPPEEDGTLGPGDEPAAVLALQQRLTELGYWLGEPEGAYGDLTEQAVLAFQKAQGLDRDSRAGPTTLAALETATRPSPTALVDGIEIDLARQLLFVIDGGTVQWVLNTSTGTSATPTPPGSFAIDREIDGIRHAPLGRLYRPKYFNGGIAIHGYSSVPARPASHGCARVSNPAMDLLWSSGLAAVGTPVRIV
jgi:peptidoglycan hydrolase-like protein with peptidoglycan-binding domain